MGGVSVGLTVGTMVGVGVTVFGLINNSGVAVGSSFTVFASFFGWEFEVRITRSTTKKKQIDKKKQIELLWLLIMLFLS